MYKNCIKNWNIVIIAVIKQGVTITPWMKAVHLDFGPCMEGGGLAWPSIFSIYRFSIDFLCPLTSLLLNQREVTS